MKVLTGLRRAGKSVMLKLIQDEIARGGVPRSNFIALNFEEMGSPRNAGALRGKVLDMASGIEGKAYLFFDEIQEVDEWEKCINSLRVEMDCDIYLTGSNARLLSGELATYLAGRYVEFAVYPFSFEEFLSMPQQHGLDRDGAFRRYVRLGGMPFLSNIAENEDACTQYLKDVYNSVILKDVVRRNNIRDVDQLDRVISYVLANIGHPFSASSISRYFRSEQRSVSHETVLNYIKACSDAYLFYKVGCADLRGKKLLTVNEKYYVADHGLRGAVYGQGQGDIDQILENIVCMELLRRGYDVAVGRNAAMEIDFIASKGRDRIYVQVCYILADEGTMSREFGAYKGIPDNYPKLVLSLDGFDRSRDGILHLDLRDFLLRREWESGL